MAVGNPYRSLPARKLSSTLAPASLPRWSAAPKTGRLGAHALGERHLQSTKSATQERILQDSAGRVPAAWGQLRCGPAWAPPAPQTRPALGGGAASFPVEVDLSAASSFEPQGGQTSISRALKNECALRTPRGGQGAPAPPGVAAPFPLLYRQQGRFIEKSRCV